MTEQIPPLTNKAPDQEKEVVYDNEQLAKMQDIFLEQARKNPDIKLVELDESMRGIGGEGEKKILEKATLNYKDVRHKMLELQQELSFEKVEQDERGDIFKGEELYQHITGAKPNGKIFIQFTSFAVYMRCEKSSDFGFLFASISGETDLTDLFQQTDAYKKYAAGMATHFEYAYPGVDVPLIVENTEAYGNRTENKMTQIREFLVTHEEQHIINNFFTNALFFDAKDINIKPVGRTREDMADYAENLKKQFLRNAQDEIIAYLKEGYPPAIIAKKLLQKGSLYDYLRQYKKKLSEKFNGWFGQEAESLFLVLEEEFYKGYENDINLATALCDILLTKYSAKDIVSHLNVAPLQKWEEIKKKMIKDKQ